MFPNCNLGYPFNNQVPTAPMQLQQPPVNAQSVLNGRAVSRQEDIYPNEVPMNGTCAIFPLQDGSAIYVKQWDANGTIHTTKYEKVEENLPIKKEEEPIGWPELKAYLDERFEKIEKMTKKEAKANG